MKNIVLVALAAALIPGGADAADISGRWQGTLDVGQSSHKIVLQVSDVGGKFDCSLFDLTDELPNENRCHSIMIEGADIRFEAEAGGQFEGRLSQDGQSISGTFTAGEPKALTLVKAGGITGWKVDAASHRVLSVRTSDGVNLEILDFGGNGSPVLFVPGLGYGAHVFDRFAPELLSKHRVYALSRRGFGGSDRPDPERADYSARRLGDDVLEVMDTLKLDKPTLIGWSMGGSELSSVGSRHPDRVAALIYLDAAYAYAFYRPGAVTAGYKGLSLLMDAKDIASRIGEIQSGKTSPAEALKLIDDLRHTSLPQIEADLNAVEASLNKLSALRSPPFKDTPRQRITDAVRAGTEKFGRVDPPVLAIFAVDTPVPAGTPEWWAANSPIIEADRQAQIRHLENLDPRAKIVRIEGAPHHLFMTHADRVVREMEGFLTSLSAKSLPKSVGND
jgi:non-heme chloroperoxidase